MQNYMSNLPIDGNPALFTLPDKAGLNDIHIKVFPDRRTGKIEILLFDRRQTRLALKWLVGKHQTDTPQFQIKYSDDFKTTKGFDLIWENTGLKIRQAEIEGFDFEWNLIEVNANDELVVCDAFVLASGVNWYGGAELVRQHWPIESLHLNTTTLQTWDNGPSGINPLIQPMWTTSTGASIVSDPKYLISISMNEFNSGHELSGKVSRNTDCGSEPCDFRFPHTAYFQSAAPYPVFNQHDGDGLFSLKIVLNDKNRSTYSAQKSPIVMKYQIAAYDNPMEAQKKQLAMLEKPKSTPEEYLLRSPIWTTWARYKTDINQNKVLEFAKEIIANKYPFSVMEIDDKWSSAHGDLEFNSTLFPDPKKMVDQLHDLGFKVTLWVTPFAEESSKAYHEGRVKGYWVKDGADPSKPAPSKWWNGTCYILDVTNNEAVEWFVNRLKKMQKDFGIDGFKFDGGESNFLDRTNNPAAFSNNATMFNKNYYSTKWIELANQFACGEVRTGYNSQSNHHLMRQWDKASIWGLDNGLESVITGALTFGVLGYPYVLPDMIGGNDWGQPPTKELMVRWAQANALLPSMQFSIPPWTFDGECAQLCLKAVEWHQKYADLIVQLAKEATETGWPIVRPMFWLAPNDKKTYTIGDQFVLGDKVIVAPIVKQGQFLRYVYLPFPNKSWKEVSSGSVFQGGDWHTITATLDHLPIFVLAKDEDVKLFKDQQAAKSAAYIKNQKIPDVPQTGASKTVL